MTPSGDPTTWMALDRAREELVDFVWHGGTLPTRPADAASRNFMGPPEGGSQVDLFRSDDIGGRGGSNYFFWITPAAAENGRILICHVGHEPSWSAYAPMLAMVEAALAEGYCVLGMSMPNIAPNPSPLTLTVGGVPVVFTGHEFKALDYDGGTSAMCQFVEPVVIAINQALVERPGYTVCMMGHSGGGQMAEFAAAVDARIAYSASVFGSCPWYINDYSSAVESDWEQCQDNQVFEHGGLHLWRHALRGESRRAVNIMSDGDEMFSPTGKHGELADFAALVSARIPTGEYAIHYDTSATDHNTWHTESVPWIIADIEAYLNP